MNSKIALLLGILLLLSGAAFADIGPSPYYAFSISNMDDYQDYEFYYSGNLWQDRFTHISETNQVYKLNTTIIVYAIPKREMADCAGLTDITDCVGIPESTDFIKSQVISLLPGHTTFEIQSFDPAGKTMYLHETGRIVDDDYEFEFLLYSIILPLLIFIIPIAIPIILVVALVIAAAIFLLKKSKEKK